MQHFWLSPLRGDRRYPSTPAGGSQITPAKLPAVAQAAEQLDLPGILHATGAACPDAWLRASLLALIGEIIASNKVATAAKELG